MESLQKELNTLIIDRLQSLDIELSQARQLQMTLVSKIRALEDSYVNISREA